MPSKPCQPGCVCGKHDNPGPVVKSYCCPPGCECGRHRGHTFVSRQESEDRHREQQRDWTQDNREKLNGFARARRAADPEAARAKGRARYAADPGYMRTAALASYHRHGRKNYLKLLYNLSPERFAEIIEEQGGNCYMCSEPLDLDNPRFVHVDHDHRHCRGERSCGACVLGVACHHCNKGCGHFGDDPDRMERVAIARRAAMAEVDHRVATLPIQGELPLNVVQIDRQQESA